MKKIFFILVVLFCFITGVYKAFFYFERKSELEEQIANKSVSRLSAEELGKIQPGDIILRRGFGFFSDFIADNLNDGDIDVTHAGIIVKKQDSLFVIHSLSSDMSAVDGMQQQPLQDFLQYSAPGKIIITRAKTADSSTGNNIARQAEYYLKQEIPFDHKGKFDDDTALYCTEMIWKILEKDLKIVTLPQEVTARKAFFFSMMPMYDTNYFDIIINQYETK